MYKLNEIEIRELDFKLEMIMYCLIRTNGYEFKLFNHPLPCNEEPDSNIIEYMEDIINLINKLKG